MGEEDDDRVGPTAGGPPLLLRPRREPFEHGLLPIPKLIFTDGTLTLASLKAQLLQNPNPNPTPEAVSKVLGIHIDHARLVLDALASVLPPPDDRRDPTVGDLLLFLYMQNYKRLLPRGHRDSAAVADVWPSTSAFDGCLSALSPIQHKSIDSPEDVSKVLSIHIDHDRLVLDALASVLLPPDDRRDPTFGDLLFLYMQNYKRLLPRGQRDSAAVADVWPSTSAFDGCLSTLSPIQARFKT